MVSHRYAGNVRQAVTNSSGTLRAHVFAGTDLPGGQVEIVCIDDIKSGQTYAVLNLPLPWRPISDLAWSNDRYVQFNRWSQPQYGMHYLIDTSTMKLVNATPFPDEFYLSEQSKGTTPDSGE